MGEVIERIKVKSLIEKEEKLNVYFDSGSPYTFISKRTAKILGGTSKLPRPYEFKGLGNGKFASNLVIHIEFNLLGIWCSHIVYVVDNEITGEESDVLCGHDFMQKYDIKLDTKKKRIILNKASLKRAQVVR